MSDDYDHLAKVVLWITTALGVIALAVSVVLLVMMMVAC